MIHPKNNVILNNIISPHESGIKSCIFDLENVLFNISYWKQIVIILKITLRYPFLLYTLCTTNIKKEFFNILHKVPAQTQDPNEMMYNKNQKIPPILVDWMTGRADQHLLPNTITCITKSNYSPGEKALFCSIVTLLFTPQHFIQAAKPLKSFHQLVYALKNQGYKLYILSNWDKESLPLLIHKYQIFFSVFDGIMISGTEGIGKPHTKIYKNLLQKYNINPYESIFIDDEQHNIQTANKLGIHGVLQDSFKSVCNQLKKIGIMKK